MNAASLARAAAVLAIGGLLAACSGTSPRLTPFTKIDGSDPSVLAKMDGSWTVINTGGNKVEGMTPPAVMVFDTRGASVSGFDGCNDFRGSYTFEQGRLTARVQSTRRACTSELARTVSTRINDLLAQGAEVVDTAFMGANVLMLKNANGDVRMGPTDVLKKQ